MKCKCVKVCTGMKPKKSKKTHKIKLKTGTTKAKKSHTIPLHLDAKHFASRVQSLVDAVPKSQRWGSRKVWISDIVHTPQERQMLLDAHRAGKIELTRHDVTPALSPAERKKQEASELSYMHARFHLISAKNELH